MGYSVFKGKRRGEEKGPAYGSLRGETDGAKGYGGAGYKKASGSDKGYYFKPVASKVTDAMKSVEKSPGYMKKNYS